MTSRALCRTACMGGLALTLAGCGAAGMFLSSRAQARQDRLGDQTISERFGSYSHLSERLLLTSDQKTKARDIDRRLDADLKGLRDTAQQQFVAVLTPD